MNPDYSDIIEAVGRQPLWFYGDGVPRYRPFHPQECGVYDNLALLVEIACQGCGKRVLVGEGWTKWGETKDFDTQKFGYAERTLRELAEGYHYGDPPAHGCGGDSMNCIDLRIVEAWERGRNWNNGLDWQRRPEIEEIDILPEWVEEWRRERLGLDD